MCSPQTKLPALAITGKQMGSKLPSKQSFSNLPTLSSRGSNQSVDSQYNFKRAALAGKKAVKRGMQNTKEVGSFTARHSLRQSVVVPAAKLDLAQRS